MKRVLVADDSRFMRMSIINVVKEKGFVVVGEAENGVETIQKYKELVPDIVTLDITMNELNGLEALKGIIEFNPNAAVVIISSMGQEAIIKEALYTGAKDFIIKPFKPETVFQVLDRL